MFGGRVAWWFIVFLTQGVSAHVKGGIVWFSTGLQQGGTCRYDDTCVIISAGGRVAWCVLTQALCVHVEGEGD